MNKLSLLFESPPWLIGIGVLIGLAYAVVLYFRTKVPWGKNTNYVLACLRFVMVSLLTLLLFGPLIRQIKNTTEPPSIVFAIDNSQSIAEIEDSVQLTDFQKQLNDFQTDLQNHGYFTEIRTLDGPASNKQISFNENSSNLNKMLQGIQNDYESKNLSNVLLFSDGLYNLGNNPAFHPFNFRVSTIGMGDTTQHPDLNLNAVLYNKIAYEGNKFPIVAELSSYNLAGKEVTIQLSQGGKVLEQKKLKVSNLNQYDQIEFLVEADGSGMKRYTVHAMPMSDEFTLSNNAKEAFIDIIDGKQKILLVAPAPHPDIKAIKNALESNENYELVTYIQGIDPYVEDKYDAMILHQIPDKKESYRSILDKMQKEKIPAFFIYGNRSDINLFNDLNGNVRIQPINYQKDQVFPLYNNDFTKFLYTTENIEALNGFSPVKVPFANYTLLPNAEVMLYQKVGKVNTQKPLLVLQRGNDWSSATLLGEGIWAWRLQEYAQNQNHLAFDEMISKVIQFLSTKEDKRKFKVYPVKNGYLNNETIEFETEVYNDIFEKTYGHKIDLQIANEQNQRQAYSYVTNEKNSVYRISGLDNGIYTYRATSSINGKNVAASGTFTVKDLQIETTKLTADHNLLRNIAQQNGGAFYTEQQLDQLKDDLLQQDMVGKIYSSEKYLAIINLKWSFFILLLFVSAEWLLRKYHGSY